MTRWLGMIVLLGATLAPTASSADPAAVAAAQSPGTCPAGSLVGVVSLYGAAGQRAGQVTLVNRGRAPCVLRGRPRISIVRSNGRTLAVRQIGGPGAGPLQAIELVPGQRAVVPVQWGNYCGSSPGRTLFVLQLPWGGAIAVPPDTFMGSTIPVPPCLGRGQPSTLGVGTFLPPPDDPANALLAYYSDLNQRAYRPAYGMLTGQKPAYKAFAAGYRNTAHVTINVVATPLYRTRRHGLAYTCVGIRFTALSTAGRGTGYGGWYLVATRGQMDFSIVPARSAIHVNGGLVLPTGAACAGTVP